MLLVIWPDPVITVGRQAFITDVITAAGGQSVTEDLPQQWPQISLEEVLRRNPDWLLLPANGHQPISLADLERRPGWDRVEAVRRHRVIYYDERLDHPSPRGVRCPRRLSQTAACGRVFATVTMPPTDWSP